MMAVIEPQWQTLVAARVHKMHMAPASSSQQP
eukprot:CAMPEP_0179371166 /NCGR_PEP_ID=MMETSP0797-20121207/85577_1 /TAXON_ID=47934 /ORGANISM="Dinophysis acuminata, Strain DAEP01" /LENGTH=31 /DNA_ID= /DNA_START= /DNA_END= /DNA_ORIENTATION=